MDLRWKNILVLNNPALGSQCVVFGVAGEDVAWIQGASWQQVLPLLLVYMSCLCSWWHQNGLKISTKAFSIDRLLRHIVASVVHTDGALTVWLFQACLFLQNTRLYCWFGSYFHQGLR